MNKQYEEVEIKRIADFHHSLNHCPIHLFGLRRDAEGEYKFTYSVGSMLDELGVSIKPSPGTNLHDLYNKELIAEWTKPLERAFSGSIQTADIHLGVRRIRTTIYPVTGNHRDVLEVVGTSYLMSSRDEEQTNVQDLKKFKQLFNHALEAIVLCRSNMEIVEVNDRACDLLELSKEALIGSSADQFFVGNGKERILKKWQEVLNGKKIEGEFRYKTPDGLVKEIEYSCEKDIVDDLHVTVLRDVTDQKLTEQKLLKAEALNVVGELAAGVAHEIRNPLTSLKGFVQLIQNQTGEFDQYLSIILTEVDRIEHIIKEFLVLSKSNSQNFMMSCVTDIINDTVDLLNTQAIIKNIEIKKDLDDHVPLIFCDPLQLKQVFINFLKNAIEASAVGDCVEINMKLSRKKDFLQVQIRDYGCGMDETVMKKIGKPFFTTKNEGTGLGLMVSTNIIKHHNGRLDVKSKKGSGTMFTITIPIQ
ncbi:ATP-binding protein [Fictibacillus phosphorivorans]|uniref:ATP-binding protein n=1 Tax=Fictibacillus phosphorivorans TaxID=1221500 RepID=UPI001293D684|nr:ATP-binding protein [Fictibacillus phosphorivorans]MQR97440.1 PAS domain S-box protein [Fictibacillus phosphorivorans]